MIIGGWRVVPGPIYGAIAVIFLPDLLDVGPLITAWIYGGGLIATILLFPDGIGGTLLDRLRPVVERKLARRGSQVRHRLASGPDAPSGGDIDVARR